MEAELVGYVLGALDDDEQEQVARALRDSAELIGRLELLRGWLALLEMEQSWLDPPRHLALETCRRLREQLGRSIEPKEPES